eukprot:gb/GECG01002498.1/.p1 GENE.gb/GECG01002498.1/~~gb/GECG01002498.1/.p1  ORF type:complete len:690 (+),score=55.96 gb/GECG01002498.1/:1-2070(+)
MNGNTGGKILKVQPASRRGDAQHGEFKEGNEAGLRRKRTQRWNTQTRARGDEDATVNVHNLMPRVPRHENSQSPSPLADTKDGLPRTRSRAWNSISTAMNDLDWEEYADTEDMESPKTRRFSEVKARESLYERTDAGIAFDTGRFIRTFLYHALYPVSLPFLVWIEGSHYLYSMSFLSSAPKDVINSHVFPLMLLFTNIVVAGGFSSLSKGGPTVFEVVMVDLYYLFRILVIGIKYATLSDKLYKEMGYKLVEEGQEINAQNMLVTGWMNPQKSYVEDEISSEEKRTGFDLKRAFFKVDNRLHSYFDQIFREGDLQEGTESGSSFQKTAISAVCAGKSRRSMSLQEDDIESSHRFGDISARRITLALWLQNIWPNNAGYAITVQVALTTIFRVVTPVIVADAFNRLSELGSSPLDLLPRIFIMIVGSHLQFSLLTFLMIGILDYYRRHKVSSGLTALSRNTKVTFIKGDSDDEVKTRYRRGYLELVVPSVHVTHSEHTLLPPVLDLSIAENAFAWYRLRLVLRHTGRRFSLRLQTYVSVMLIILLGLNIIFFIRFLSVGQDEFMGDYQSVLLFAEVVYMNLTILGFITLMIIHGSLANAEMEAQNEIFVKASVKLEELRREYPEDSTVYREVNSTLQALRTVRDVVQMDDMQAPVKILGFRASPLLLRGMAAGVLTVVSAVIGRLFLST